MMLLLLASPIVSAACACASHENARSVDSHSHNVAGNDCHSAQSEKASDERNAVREDGEKSLGQNGCCCAKNSSQSPLLFEKKRQQTERFNYSALPARLDFIIASTTEVTEFYRSDIFYPARSALSNKPSRAPPGL